MKKLYVIVRSDLSKSQQAVQAAHAVAQFLKDHPDTEWPNGTLVLLKVPSLLRLIRWMDYAQSYFIEPDIGDEITAIAHYGKGDKFKNLKLL